MWNKWADMSDVAKHYETLLARHYSWMVGTEFAAKAAEQQALLEELGAKGRSGLAIDLGCGPGYQSVALAGLGLSPVRAVDGSEVLLKELSCHAKGLAIEPVRADIRDVKKFTKPGSASVIVCMGDTLTHLQSLDDVSQLLADAHEALTPGGLLVLTFRDLSVERSGLDRFLPIRADADRIMTCVLEFETDHVVINDLIYVREGESWSLHKNSYRKVRLGVEDVLADLRLLGFAIRVNKPLANGMQAIAALKAPV
jgi:2-polyprenyl-3-methyl-5-hydroxy-6-metoxy-1,4-benzoquinol methylase